MFPPLTMLYSTCDGISCKFRLGKITNKLETKYQYAIIKKTQISTFIQIQFILMLYVHVLFVNNATHSAIQMVRARQWKHQFNDYLGNWCEHEHDHIENRRTMSNRKYAIERFIRVVSYKKSRYSTVSKALVSSIAEENINTLLRLRRAPRAAQIHLRWRTECP